MSLEPARRHYAAVFLISLSLLMLEISTARVLSVALASHFAFVAISVAMFGLGLSGLTVYLFPGHFRADRLERQLVSYGSRFGVAAAISILVFLRVQVVQELSARGIWTLSLAYVVLAVPFFFGGVCIALLMTHFAFRIGRVYCADLIGASLGCIAVVAAMQLVPAPVVAAIVAVITTGTALGLASLARPRRLLAPLAASAFALIVLLLGLETDLLRMRYIKNWKWDYSQYEVWNAFSRVSVFRSKLRAAQHVRIEDAVRPASQVASPKTKLIDIDGGAWTPMMRFKGDFSELGFLRESVMYVAHHLRPGGKVLIVGTGGGRDILAARTFGQPSILGIELNPLLRHVVQEQYGNYSGRPYTLPGVEVIVDEARSRLGSLDRTFDVLQISLIDTFALNAAGGFVYSENYLYTQEAFQDYFRHLSPDGIFTVSRYFVGRYPLEILKLAGLARAAWAAEGVAAPGNQIVVLGQGIHFSVLAKRSPFTAQELATLRDVAGRNGMTIFYEPGMTGDDGMGLRTLMTTPDVQGFIDAHPYQIGPPTDDKPFFFNFLRGRLAAEDVPDKGDDPFLFMRLWNEAVLLMYLLVAVVTSLTLVFFFGPLLLVRRQSGGRVRTGVAAPLLLYFACLGYGFMMIEIPLLQRLVLLLGYPVYALTVVLASLLLFSGLGSLLSGRLPGDPQRALVRSLVVIVVLGAAYTLLVPSVVHALLALPIAMKVVAAVTLLAPIGLVLGMAYPLGITVLRDFGEDLVPWAWSLNGALSVVASVAAIFLGSRIGFTASMLTGVLAYGVALTVMLAVPRLRLLNAEAKEAARIDPASARRAVGAR